MGKESTLKHREPSLLAARGAAPPGAAQAPAGSGEGAALSSVLSTAQTFEERDRDRRGNEENNRRKFPFLAKAVVAERLIENGEAWIQSLAGPLTTSGHLPGHSPSVAF